MNNAKLLQSLKEEAQELIDFGNSREKAEGCGMQRVINEIEFRENNADKILMAEFIGAREDEDGEFDFYGTLPTIEMPPNQKHSFRPDEFLFDSKWGWIMRIVEKIESLGYWVNVKEGDAWIVDGDGNVVVDNPTHSYSRIKLLYHVCMEFLKTTKK